MDDTNQSKHDGNSQKRSDKPRAQGGKRRVFSRIAKVVTGFVVVSLTATEAMMFILFGRSDPVLTEPFWIQNWATDAGCYWKEFEFRSNSNMLKGYLICPQNPKAVCTVVHGIKSSSDAFEPVVQYLVQDGYAVLCFDGTASGRSEGSRTMGLQQQRYDLRALLEYADGISFLRDLPLVLLGHSAGAYGVATEANYTRAVAAACVSGFEAPLKTMRYWAKHYAGAISSVEYPFLLMREYTVKGSDADTSASYELMNGHVPTLIAQGSNDEVVYEEISLYNYAVDQKSPEIRSIYVRDSEHNGHSNILVSNGKLNEWLMRQICDFFDAYI